MHNYTCTQQLINVQYHRMALVPFDSMLKLVGVRVELVCGYPKEVIEEKNANYIMHI